MHSAKNLAFGLLAAAALAAASDVTQLKADTFNDFVTENNLVLAECKLIYPVAACSINAKKLTSCRFQSLLPGAVTARLWPPSMRRLLRP